jgi:predicted porin
MYKKSLLAMALTSAAFSNVAMAAPTADIYGFVDIGLEHYNESGISNGSDVYAGSDTPNGNSDAQEFALTNNVQSRIGIKGEEDIQDGWKGTYRMEYRANVLESGGEALRIRLGWLGLEKGDHSFKMGTQWSPYMQYSGWNTNRGEAQGVASYFYVTDEMKGSLAYGFRNSSTISYTYGKGGWGASSPVSATIALHVGDDSRSVEVDGKDQLTNDSGITGVTLAAARTFGPLTVNAVYVKNIVNLSDAGQSAPAAAEAALIAANTAVAAAVTTYETDKAAGQLTAAKEAVKDASEADDEPSIYSVGAKYQVTDKLEFGFAHRGADRDTESDKRTSSSTLSTQYTIDDAWNIHVGVARGQDDNENARQLESNIFGQVWYQATDSRSVRFEFDHADYGDDGEALITLVSMRQAF